MRALVLFTAAVVAAVSAGHASARHDATPNPFTTPASRAADIHFVPLDARAARLVRQTLPALKPWLKRSAEVTEIPTPSTSWVNPARRQLNSLVVMRDIMKRFRSAQGRRPAFLVPVTTQSIYIAEKPEWRFVFGAYFGAGTQVAAIVATAQMRVFHPEREKARMTKMILRDIGFVLCGLPKSNDPKSVLFANIRSDADLDRMVATLPKGC